MNFTVSINNIGKLKSASISVRPLTILAGPNNTGKSFFSKTLYSVLDAINTNPIHSLIKYNLRSLNEGLRMIQLVKYGSPRAIIRKKTSKTSSLTSEEEAIHLAHTHIVKTEKLLFHAKIEEQDFPLNQVDSNILKSLEKIINSYPKIISLFEQEKHKESQLFSEHRISRINKDIENLKKITKDTKLDQMFSEGFCKILEENLTGNFQVPRLDKIKRDANHSASIDISSIGEITINSDIQTKIPLIGFTKLQNTSRVIYIESPFYWKQKQALSLLSNRLRTFSSTRRSLMLPKYFEDLNTMLMEELSGDMAFPDVFKKLTKRVGGKITINEIGALRFKESEGITRDLPMMSTGIVQLAIIALLIEKKVLDKNSVLIIDEPETNLHPAWQVIMMDTLLDLVKTGMHIVIATHSIDIIKYLEVMKNPKQDDLIGLNHLKVNEEGLASVFNPEGSMEEKIKSIKKELANPYVKMFLQGRKNDV